MEGFIPPRSGELLDIVDEQGNPTGQILKKKRIHDHGLLHGVSHGFITNGTHFLQQRRADDKEILPGEWDISVGEHIGAGEAPIDAVVRGAREELGLLLPRECFRPVGRLAMQELIPGWAHPHNVISQNFVARVDRDLSMCDLVLQEEEVSDARWYPIDQLVADLAHPETATRHAPHDLALYGMGIMGMRGAGM